MSTLSISTRGSRDIIIDVSSGSALTEGTDGDYCSAFSIEICY